MAISVASSLSSSNTVQIPFQDPPVAATSPDSAPSPSGVPDPPPFPHLTLQSLGLGPIVDGNDSAAALAELALKFESTFNLSKLASQSVPFNSVLGNLNAVVQQIADARSKLQTAKTQIVADQQTINQLTASQALSPSDTANLSAAKSDLATQQGSAASYQATISALTTNYNNLALAFNAMLEQMGGGASAGGSSPTAVNAAYFDRLSQQMAPRQAPNVTADQHLFNNDETQAQMDQDRLAQIALLVMQGFVNVLASLFSLLPSGSAELAAATATTGGHVKINA